MSTDPGRERPVVYHSNRLRLIVLLFSLGLLLLGFVFWIALPANLRAEFTLSQAVTLLIILVGFVFALLVIGSGVVKADADALYFRNGLSRHRYPWSRVHGVVLRPGDAWAHVLLIPTGPAVGHPAVQRAAEFEHRMLMGIQTGDGAYAVQAVAELNRRARADGSG